MSPRFRRPGAALAFALLCGAPAHAISRGPERVTTESPHFAVSVERSKRPLAAEAAALLEQAYAFESEFFDFKIVRDGRAKKRVQVVLLDDEDFSNGYAFAANSWIVIYMPPARFELRGPARWLPNVTAHELAHLITLRKMGADSRLLGIEAFASVGRYGRGDGRIDGDAAWIPDNVPAWLAEGLAQYAAMRAGHDSLDAHRTMLLRQAWLSGSLLPLKAMEEFSGDARAGEAVYNQGFHLVDFFYRKYGRDAANAMMDHWDAHGYRGAFQKAFGATPEAIYREWRAELDARFRGDAEPAPLYGPSYAVETAPYYDSASATLYYLSSRANDFGILHLYAKRGGSSRLIRRDVSPPLRAGADGSLLFPSARIERSSGAVISDLYRLRLDDGSVERLTRGQRVIAGVEVEGYFGPPSLSPPDHSLYALLQHRGRPRLARLMNGRPAQWFDAPPGSEFTDLAAGDSALYVGTTAGRNADILRFDLRSAAFQPVAATAANETGPFFHGGRLYYAADDDGAYAIHSRGSDSPRRHTPPGKSAFTPFAGGGNLYFSEYATAGFRIRSLPLAESAELPARADAPAVGTPQETATASAPPPVPPLKKLDEDRIGMGLLGYYATLGYAYTPSVLVRTDGFGREDGVYRLNPCGHQGYLGGGLVWSDPTLRSLFSMALLTGQCASEVPLRGTHVPFAQADYLSQNSRSDHLISAQYHSSLIDAPWLSDSEPRLKRGTLHDLSVIGGNLLRLGSYAQNATFLMVGAAWADLPEATMADDPDREDIIQGAMLGAGNTLSFAVLEPGIDFINQGLYADGTLVLAPGVLLTGLNGGVYANAWRALFLGVHGDVFRIAGDAQEPIAGWSATADYRIPLRTPLGGAGYRGMFLESMFLRSAFLQRWNEESGIGLTNPSLEYRAVRTSRERLRLTGAARGNQGGGSALAPVAQAQNLAPVNILLGLRLKAISPGSRVVFWDVQWQIPPDDPGDGYFSVSLSL